MVSKEIFGTLANGQTVYLYVLKNNSMLVTLSEYGAALVSALLPRSGAEWDDVVLGYSTLSGYMNNAPFFGVTVGRFANRIAGGRFTLDGREYALARNDGKNHIHGGPRGFDKKVWKSEAWEDRGSACVRFSLRSPDGDEGYPGTLDAAIVFSLSAENVLTITYEAKSDAPTPINLTNHSYFNLKGEGRGDILDHTVRLASSRYVEVDSSLLPTGRILDVEETPFDFRTGKPPRRDISNTSGGYDHCFIVDRNDASSKAAVPCAEVLEPETGRTLSVRTTSPGVQFYTGNFLNGVRGKRGAVYDRHAGFCLETGYFPDSPNQEAFPGCVLRPNCGFLHSTAFQFGF